MESMMKILLLVVGFSISDCIMVVSIHPSKKHIIRRESEDLSLTCKVSFVGDSNSSYDFTWKVPIKIHDIYKRMSVQRNENELSITIHKLQEKDTGQYICEVNDNGIIQRRKVGVLVKSNKDKCSNSLFHCGENLCISKFYVCDGFDDCPNGTDEAIKQCGANPCYGKFMCDGRCIPSDLCCDPVIDSNCTASYLMPCCQKLLPTQRPKAKKAPPKLQISVSNVDYFDRVVYLMGVLSVTGCMTAVFYFAICYLRILYNTRFSRGYFFQSITQRFNHVNRRARVTNISTNQVVYFNQERSPNLEQSTTNPAYDFHLCSSHQQNVRFTGEENFPPPCSQVNGPPPPYSSKTTLTVDIG